MLQIISCENIFRAFQKLYLSLFVGESFQLTLPFFKFKDTNLDNTQRNIYIKSCLQPWFWQRWGVPPTPTPCTHTHMHCQNSGQRLGICQIQCSEMGTVSLLRDDQYIDGCKSLFTFFQKMITEVFKETCVSVFRSVTRCFCIHGGFGHITRKLFPSPGLHSQELCFSLIPVPLKEEMYLVLMF